MRTITKININESALTEIDATFSLDYEHDGCGYRWLMGEVTLIKSSKKVVTPGEPKRPKQLDDYSQEVLLDQLRSALIRFRNECREKSETAQRVLDAVTSNLD